MSLFLGVHCAVTPLFLVWTLSCAFPFYFFLLSFTFSPLFPFHLHSPFLPISHSLFLTYSTPPLDHVHHLNFTLTLTSYTFISLTLTLTPCLNEPLHVVNLSLSFHISFIPPGKRYYHHHTPHSYVDTLVTTRLVNGTIHSISFAWSSWAFCACTSSTASYCHILVCVILSLSRFRSLSPSLLFVISTTSFTSLSHLSLLHPECNFQEEHLSERR